MISHACNRLGLRVLGSFGVRSSDGLGFGIQAAELFVTFSFKEAVLEVVMFSDMMSHACLILMVSLGFGILGCGLGV